MRDHALPVEAGHWEKVTESKRTLVLLHGGHHTHQGLVDLSMDLSTAIVIQCKDTVAD